MRRALSALLAGLLAASAVAAVAPGDVTAELSPRDGRTAVSVEGDSKQLLFGGRVQAGSTPTATLQAVDHGDAVLRTWDVSSRVAVGDGGTVSGSMSISCFYVPGCPGTSPGSPERKAALDAMGGYRLELRVEDVSDVSDVVDFDPHPPLISGYFLTSATTIEVRFTEDVVDPDGDAPADWLVDDVRRVQSVQGGGDTRVLTLLTPYEDGATPEVWYLPQPSLDSSNLPNRPYVDRAGNELDADGRLGQAADAIPPPVPTIESIEGTAVTYESSDAAVPVLGNDPTPEVVVGDVGEDAIAQLHLDDGDGAFEPDGDDVLVGEAAGDGSGSATIESSTLPGDGVHRFWARARDEALCDPDDPSAGTCPNHSGRSQEARYDLDTVAPTPVAALSHQRTIVVDFTEALVGTDDPGQWTVDNPGGGAVLVEQVSGSGATRTLQISGGPIVDTPVPNLDWTAPGSDPYRDEHGNVLDGFPLRIDVAPLPVLSVEPADVTEGDPPAVPGNPLDPAPTLDFTLRVSDIPAGEEVDVAWETVLGGDGDAGAEDYEADSGTATITGVDGPDEAVVSVAVTRDQLHEFDEAVFLQVRNVDDGAPRFTLPGGAASLTTAADILDDDDPVRATISPATADVDEGPDASIDLTVQLDAVSGRPVTIDWATVVADDPAEGEAGVADVPAQSGSVTIPAGEQSASFAVEVADDAADEPDETFRVDLAASEAANATLGDPSSAELTIIDDDVPVPTLTVEAGTVAEDDYTLPVVDNAQLPFTFRLSEAPEQAIEVSWTTDDTGTATQDADFAGDSGFVRFEQGETEQTVLVDVVDDDLHEAAETVALRVADPAAAVLVDDAGQPVAELTTTGTITDDDPEPTIAFADGSTEVTVDEGDRARFTVALGAVSGRDASVDWTTVFDGTADTGDLPAQSGTVTVEEGATTATFDVTTLGDAADDGERTVTVELSSPEHADLVEPTRATLTIGDDLDGVPTITVTGGEGDEDPGVLPPLTTPSPVPFTVELSRVADQDVTVRWGTTGGGTATPSSDFTGASGTLTIPQGETSGVVEVEVLADELDEPDETVEVELSEPAGAALAGDGPVLAATGTILDDDAPVVASLGEDDTVDEGETVVLDVTLDAASGHTVRVDWQTVNGSADGSDYTQASGTLEFEPGETSRAITVPTIDDAAVEGDEDLLVELTGAEHASIGNGEAVVTIADDDVAVPGQNLLSLSSATVTEGDPVGPFPALVPTASLDFALTLQEDAAEDVEVDYVVAPGTADGASSPGDGRDVDPVADGTVTIPAGSSTATIEAATYADLLDEFDETVIVTVTDVRGGTAALPPAGLERTGRILDDDPLAAVAFADGSMEVEVTEGGTVALTVELDTASGKPVTVSWATAHDGTADTADVAAQSGQVTVAAGQTTVTFEVATEDDELREPDEDLAVVLSDPVNGRLADGGTTARITLLDDELPVLRVEGGSVDEGAVGLLGPADPGVGLQTANLGPAPSPLEEDLVFTVTLDEAVAQDATVRWATTTLGTATAGSDHTAASGTLTIPAGETTGEVAVDIHLDDLDEWDETVIVRFSDARGAQLAGGADAVEVAGTIVDDDPVVVVDLGADVTVAEGEPARFEVTLSDAEGNEKDSGKDIELRYRTSDGSARAGEDYRAVDGTLTIPAGDTSGSFTIPTLDDGVAEPTEDLEVTLSVVGEDAAALGRSAATLQITDDDLGVDPGDTVVSLTGDAVEEGDPSALPLPGGNELSFVVQLSEPADGDVTLSYVTRAGTATAGQDFESADGQVTIPDGEDAATVTVPVVGDFTDEFDEDLELVLTGVEGDAVLPGGELARTGRILDDDPQAQLRSGDATVLEGDVAELDVTLDNASGKDITVAWELVDGTATAGSDYVAGSGTLTFPAGTTSRIVQVATLEDADTGELIEQLELVLSGATNAGIDDSRGTVSIVDIGADGLPTQTAVFLEDVTVEEADGDRTALVPVRLSGERDEDTTVTWSSQELSAAEGEDYRAAGGQVTIPAGATSAQIPVTIIGDDEVEPDEDFLVLLTEADGAVITGPTGRVTITDDDAADDGGGGGPGGGGEDGAPDGSDGGGSGGPDGSRAGAGDLPATGGGAGIAVLGLALLAARRRRD